MIDDGLGGEDPSQPQAHGERLREGAQVDHQPALVQVPQRRWRRKSKGIDETGTDREAQGTPRMPGVLRVSYEIQKFQMKGIQLEPGLHFAPNCPAPTVLPPLRVGVMPSQETQHRQARRSRSGVFDFRVSDVFSTGWPPTLREEGDSSDDYAPGCACFTARFRTLPKIVPDNPLRNPLCAASSSLGPNLPGAPGSGGYPA
jgi:hypothetical protein